MGPLIFVIFMLLVVCAIAAYTFSTERTLVLSSKAETVTPVTEHQESDISRRVRKKRAPMANAKPMFSRICVFLSEPAKKGRMSNLVTLLLLSGLLSGVTALIWHLAGSWVNFVTVGKVVLAIVLAIGLPIYLLSLFETGRKILIVLFYVFRVLFMVLDAIGGRGGSSFSGGFSGSGGGFGGGGASGKW